MRNYHPSVRKSEALVSDHGGARKTKCAHDNGGRNVNGFEQRQSLVRAFVSTRVEWWSGSPMSVEKSILDDERINSDTLRSVGPDVEEIGLVGQVKVA
jgi:hypothetical protein